MEFHSSPSPLSRRRFLHSSVAAGAALAAAAPFETFARTLTTSARFGGAGAPKRILILGGTGFLGPAVVTAAKARGHSLTLFNRGRTEKRIGEIDGVEKLYGNRDPNLPADETQNEAGEYVNPSPRGLESIQQAIEAGAEWDAVLDNSGYYPRMVTASAELLAPAASQYIFISSISVYSGNAQPNQDETAPVALMDDPSLENMGAQGEYYGALKALCEQAAEAAFPGRTANLRPGLIVGPGDPTDRFTYWPVRMQRGGEVLAPGNPVDPVQLIDVNDLAEFIVHLIETSGTGVMNVINPAPGDPPHLTIGATLEACRSAARDVPSAGAVAPGPALTWVPADFLAEQNVSPWGDMPLWIPPAGDGAGFHTRSNGRAVAAGLTFRPVEVTAASILEWWPREIERRVRVTAQLKEDARNAGRPEPQMADPTLLRAGITPEREAEVLAAWKAR